MNFDGMSQWMGPGLGGIMAGTEQRQLEEQRAAQTQNSLQQILASQGAERRAPQEMAMRQAQEARAAELQPLEVEKRTSENKAAAAKFSREEMGDYINDTVKLQGAPGFEDTMYQKYPKFRGHPIEKMTRAAIAYDSESDSPGGAVQKMLDQITSTPASIEQRRREEALAEKQAKSLAAAQTRVETQQAGLNERNRLSIEARQELAEAKAAAQTARIPNANQALGKVMIRLQDAIDSGDPEAIKRARNLITEAKNVLMEIAAAKTTEMGQNATARARAMGIDLPDYIPITGPKPATPTTPAAAGPRKSPSGRNVTVGPVSEATPQQGPGVLAQLADAGAAALLPSANAAPPQQQSPLVNQIPSTFGPVQQPQMPPMGASPANFAPQGTMQPGPGAIPPRPPGNPRLARSPRDFPRVSPQEQLGMSQQSLQVKEDELRQFVQVLQQTPKNHPKYSVIANLVQMLSKEIQAQKQQGL